MRISLIRCSKLTIADADADNNVLSGAGGIDVTHLADHGLRAYINFLKNLKADSAGACLGLRDIIRPEDGGCIGVDYFGDRPDVAAAVLEQEQKREQKKQKQGDKPQRPKNDREGYLAADITVADGATVLADEATAAYAGVETDADNTVFEQTVVVQGDHATGYLTGMTLENAVEFKVDYLSSHCDADEARIFAALAVYDKVCDGFAVAVEYTAESGHFGTAERVDGLAVHIDIIGEYVMGRGCCCVTVINGTDYLEQFICGVNFDGSGRRSDTDVVELHIGLERVHAIVLPNGLELQLFINFFGAEIGAEEEMEILEGFSLFLICSALDLLGPTIGNKAAVLYVTAVTAYKAGELTLSTGRLAGKAVENLAAVVMHEACAAVLGFELQISAASADFSCVHRSKRANAVIALDVARHVYVYLRGYNL